MAFTPVVRLSDGETWKQMSSFGATHEFDTCEEAVAWVEHLYPDWLRPDIFHGLQPIKIVAVKNETGEQSTNAAV
jgi:hypothetical protein